MTPGWSLLCLDEFDVLDFHLLSAVSSTKKTQTFEERRREANPTLKSETSLPICFLFF